MVSLEKRLADILEIPIDLAPARSLKAGIREQRLVRSSRQPTSNLDAAR
jgi:predicted nucleotidyltransferase